MVPLKTDSRRRVKIDASSLFPPATSTLKPRCNCRVDVREKFWVSMIESAMNTPNPKDNSNEPVRSVTSSLHPWVYATLIGLVLWLVLWIWSFAGAGVTDYLLVIVSGFFLVVVALTLILSRVGHKDSAMGDNEAKSADKPETFDDWAASDFDTYTGQLSSLQAATLILLPGSRGRLRWSGVCLFPPQ